MNCSNIWKNRRKTIHYNSWKIYISNMSTLSCTGQYQLLKNMKNRLKTVHYSSIQQHNMMNLTHNFRFGCFVASFAMVLNSSARWCLLAISNPYWQWQSMTSIQEGVIFKMKAKKHVQLTTCCADSCSCSTLSLPLFHL